jgi:transcriptional regulator with XRE-family HTH domain
METFGDWLAQEIRTRNWSLSDLARAAGLRPSTLSQVITGTSSAGPAVCRAVAKALKIPEELVFRQAGLLSPLPACADDAVTRELLEIVKHLTPDERREVSEYATWRYRRQQE